MPMPFGLEPQDSVVLTVGRLHRQKGYDYFIRAIARVKREVPGIKVLIAGEGEEENNLKNLVRSLDLTKEIIFTGLSLDVGKILSFYRTLCASLPVGGDAQCRPGSNGCRKTGRGNSSGWCA